MLEVCHVLHIHQTHVLKPHLVPAAVGGTPRAPKKSRLVVEKRGALDLHFRANAWQVNRMAPTVAHHRRGWVEITVGGVPNWRQPLAQTPLCAAGGLWGFDGAIHGADEKRVRDETRRKLTVATVEISMFGVQQRQTENIKEKYIYKKTGKW